MSGNEKPPEIQPHILEQVAEVGPVLDPRNYF